MNRFTMIYNLIVTYCAFTLVGPAINLFLLTTRSTLTSETSEMATGFLELGCT